MWTYIIIGLLVLASIGIYAYFYIKKYNEPSGDGLPVVILPEETKRVSTATILPNPLDPAKAKELENQLVDLIKNPKDDTLYFVYDLTNINNVSMQHIMPSNYKRNNKVSSIRDYNILFYLSPRGVKNLDLYINFDSNSPRFANYEELKLQEKESLNIQNFISHMLQNPINPQYVIVVLEPDVDNYVINLENIALNRGIKVEDIDKVLFFRKKSTTPTKHIKFVIMSTVDDYEKLKNVQMPPLEESNRIGEYGELQGNFGFSEVNSECVPKWKIVGSETENTCVSVEGADPNKKYCMLPTIDGSLSGDKLSYYMKKTPQDNDPECLENVNVYKPSSASDQSPFKFIQIPKIVQQNTRKYCWKNIIDKDKFLKKENENIYWKYC